MLKHLRKNWIRMLSTVLATSVCIFLFCTLQTVIEAVNFGPAQRQLEAAHNSTLRQPRIHLAAKLQGGGCCHSRRYRHCRLPQLQTVAADHGDWHRYRARVGAGRRLLSGFNSISREDCRHVAADTTEWDVL